MNKPIYLSWRNALIKSDLAATTKHVLAFLSFHTNDAGESCFPSIELLASETSLSERVVILHLKIGKELGWIEVKKHGFAGQRWARNEYRLAWPKPIMAEILINEKAVTQSNDLLEEKVVTLSAEGHDFKGKKVMTQSHTSSPMSSPMNSSYKPEPLVAVATQLKCPVKEIVKLYHECMPNNPRVVRINSTREANIRARWNECAKGIGKLFGYKTVEDGLSVWRNFFETCAASKFLSGQVAPSPGRKLFIADIDFLFRESSFTHIIENKYHRDAA